MVRKVTINSNHGSFFIAVVIVMIIFLIFGNHPVHSLTVSDNFNRADNDNITNGGTLPWVEKTGDFKILSNRLYANWTSGEVRAYWNAVFSADQFSEAKAYQTSATNVLRGAVAVRMDTATDTHYEFRVATGSGADIQTSKFVNGVKTVLNTSWNSPISNGDTIRIEVEGTTIRSYINDVLEHINTDSSIATGKPGIAGGSYTVRAEWDDWNGGDLGSAGPVEIQKTVGNPNCTGIGEADFCVTTTTPITINAFNASSIFYNNGSGFIDITTNLPFTHYFDSGCQHWLNITASNSTATIYDNESFYVDDAYQSIEKTIGDPNCTITEGLEYCVTTGTVISINASDVGCCDNITVLYRIWNGTAWSPDWVDITDSLPFDVSFLEECEHWLNITAYDCLGHQVWDNETFYVDDISPVINKTIGDPNCTITEGLEYCVTTGTVISINASDVGCCDNITVLYRIWNGTAWSPDWVDITDSLPFDVSFLEECEHWLNITAYDCLGHQVWDNETFYVELDCTFPTIEKTIGEPNRSVGCFEFEVSRDTPITINASDNGCCPSFTVEYRIWNSTSDTGWMVIGTDLLPYTFTFAERCMHNLSIRAYDCLGHMVYHQNQTFYVDHGPRGDSSEATQVIQDVFFTDEDVWALGGGFIPGDWIDIYVVPDRDWTDGDAIQPPNDVSNGVENVQADVNGDVHALVWPQPLIVGAYDIVYDADEDGFYDWGTDAIDGMSPGFIVRGTWDGVGGEGPSQVPIVSPLGLIVLTSILPLIGIIALRKKKQ